MLENRDFYQPFIGEPSDFNLYISNMEKDSEWGGNMEVFIFFNFIYFFVYFVIYDYLWNIWIVVSSVSAFVCFNCNSHDGWTPIGYQKLKFRLVNQYCFSSIRKYFRTLFKRQVNYFHGFLYLGKLAPMKMRKQISSLLTRKYKR